tara:strand:- start:111 stop:746 length:636 start_codon:yes stop_codon:yes gene_type:complete
MKHKVKAVMLPTEEEPNIGDLCTSIRPNYSNKPLIFGEFENSYKEECKKQYVYITVSQDVIGGQEVYYIDKFTNKVTSSGRAEYGSKQDVIIATTDHKLTVKAEQAGDNVWMNPIPQVQQSFLKEYVANPDREYEVEYETKTLMKPADVYIEEVKTKLKLNPDRSVIITSVEEKRYNIEEIENSATEKFKSYPTNLGKIDVELKKWIKENE